MTQTVEIQNQSFTLHPTGALYWIEKAMLLISDVHLGKVSHFRKHGAAVPRKAILRNYELLQEAIAFFNPREICFLGDLFHSAINMEWKLFEDWVSKTEIKMILVAGNHDIISPLKYEDLSIKLIEEWVLDTFLLTHHPEEREGFFNFSGHIHPAIRLKGSGRQSLKLPCFFKNGHQLILPAFGEFTGNHVLRPNGNDEVYAITKNEVILVSN